MTLAGALLSPAFAEAGKGKGDESARSGKAGKAGKAGKRGAKLAKLCERIGCSDEQAADIRVVLQQMRADIKPDREAIRELRGQLAAEWKRAKPDERKLAKIVEQIGAHERNIADRRMEAMLELHPILTPEQREEVF